MATQETMLTRAIERNRARIAKEQAEYQAWKAATIADNERRWFLEDWDEAIRDNAKK